jgi:excisionase family DNA binding protein
MRDKMSLPKLVHDDGRELVELREDLVSVKEATKILRVSEATLWRWINQVLVPAYRVGHKRVYIKRADLDPLITPAREKGGSMAQTERPRVRPLTIRERQQFLNAVAESRRRLPEMLGERGGRLYSNSADLLDASRKERSRTLA